MTNYIRDFVAATFAIMISVVPSSAAQSTRSDRGWPKICENETLATAIRVIDSACKDINCQPETLKQLDYIPKPALLAALRDHSLQATHIFFGPDDFEISTALHWKAWKEDQVKSLAVSVNPSDSIVYVIGQASVTGPPGPLKVNREYNFRLSQKRMAAVMTYLEGTLHIRCRAFRGGWLGNDIFQLTPSDAKFLQMAPEDYDGNALFLNQAVRVFVYPCADKIY